MTGSDLKKARLTLGLTQAQLAKAVGIRHTSTIGRYEMASGKYPCPRWLSLIVRLWIKQQEVKP